MKGLLHFLDSESTFGRICAFLGSVIVVNLLFILTLIPVVTAGAGLCGLYYAMLRLVRHKEISPVADFFRGFRENFKKATLAFLILAVLAVLLLVELRICPFMPSPLRYCAAALYAGLFVLLVLAVYLFPVMAAFESRLRGLAKLSIFFAVGDPLGTAGVVLLNVVPLALTYLLPALLPLAAFLWCMGGFAFVAFANAAIMMRRFRRYLEPLPSEREEAERKRILEEMKMLEG